jgi:hypothetical protein
VEPVLPVPGVVSGSLPALSLSKGRRAQNDTQSFPDGNELEVEGAQKITIIS